MPLLTLTAKEIHILVQLINFLIDSGEAFDYARKNELNAIREKLQNVKGV